MKMSISALALVAVLSLAGCASVGAGDSADSNVEPSAAPSAEATSEPTEETAPDDGIFAFGEVKTYEDGVSISVSAPSPYTPTEYAAGADQANNVVFTLVITNGSDKPLEPIIYSRLSSGGVEGSTIFDSGNAVGEVSISPTTVILPGQTVQWLEAWSIADPASITFQTSPSFEYEDAIFTNIQ